MKEAQAIIHKFEAGIPPKTLDEKIEGLLGEVQELVEVYDLNIIPGVRGTDQYHYRIADETTDVLSRCLGIIDSLGYDAMDMLLEKTQQGIDKYYDGEWTLQP